MRKIEITIYDDDEAILQKYCDLMNNTYQDASWNIETALKTLALVRAEQRIEQLMN